MPVIQYCNQCGSSVTFSIPEGDNLPRHVCAACGHIHYENPRLIVGCIAEWEGKLLLCRRAIEPRLGFWTPPAGFMENGETTAQAAARETLEEAGAKVLLDAPFALINIAHINQVHLFYRGRMADGMHIPGVESLATALFPPSEIPWPELAFSSVEIALRRYLEDRERQTFGFHEVELAPQSQANL